MKTETANKNYVVYFRVSTLKQGVSGLGLDAQKQSVDHFVKNNGGQITQEFIEIESGKKTDRPKLTEAIQLCKDKGFTLCVAKLDRLARNVFFISQLQHSGVEFVAVDNPHATKFLRQALEQARQRGVKLGNPHFQVALQKANEVRSTTAKERNGKLLAIVNEIKVKTGITKLVQLAEILNLRGIKTARNNEWTASHVFNLLNA